MALLRLAAQWRSLLTIIVGVLLTAVIGANAPLYTAAIAQLGMVQRLEQQPADKVNILTRFSTNGAETEIEPLWTALDGDVRRAVSEAFNSSFPGWMTMTAAWGETSPMFVVVNGEDVPESKLRAAYYDGWEDRINVVDGTLPVDVGDGADVDIEAALLADVGASLGIRVGDVITLDQRGWETSVPVRARVTALVTPNEPVDAYWMHPSPLRVDAGATSEANVLTTRNSFIRVAQEFIPQTMTQLGWRVLFDPTELPYSTIPQATAALKLLNSDLDVQFAAQGANLVFTTQLGALLTQYLSEISYLNAPFGLLLLQIGALVLFFLVVMVALVRRGERREIAMLQSRGAFDRQIVLLRGMEALVICGIAALVAPLIARQLLTWLAPAFAGVEHMPLVLDATPFVYAGIAGVLALLVLVGSLRPVLRLPLILAGGSAARGDKQSWWQRYYLDVVLLVIGSAALFRLVTTDSPLAQTALGNIQADPLLLLAPALLFVALGSITLRLFPVLADAAARYFSVQRGLSGALAAWQVSREPAHYGRITFLLALAIGVGWFATSFQATVKQSQQDQAEYAVGADVRLTERDNALKVDRVQPSSSYLAQPDVEAASSATRLENVNFSLSGGALNSGTILGVDGATFNQTAYWRDDLGKLGLPPAVELLQPGAVLPITPARIGVWVQVQQQIVEIVDGEESVRFIVTIPLAIHDMHFFARVHDETGAYILVPLQAVQVEGAEEIVDLSQFNLNTSQFMTPEAYQAESERLANLTRNLSGWVYLEGALPAVPQGETRLDMLYWTSHISGASFVINSVRGTALHMLNLSELTLIDEAGTTTPFDILNEGEWEAVLDGSQSAAAGTFSSQPEGRPAGRSVRWTQYSDRATFGIALNYPEIERIPAIISAPYAAETNLPQGASFDLFYNRLRLRFSMLDTTRYYPTLYADRAPFLIADQAALLYALNRYPGTAIHANEAWLRLTPGVSSNEYVEQARVAGTENDRPIARAITLDDALASLQTDALSLGLIGLLFIAFAVALALSAISLLTYTALTLQVRRNEFAVLRALGAASQRLITSIALEQAFVFVMALLLGALLGFLLSKQVLPTLAFSTTGGAITPPFIVQVETPVLLQYGLILLVVLALVLLGSLLLVRRLSLAQALRYGEE